MWRGCAQSAVRDESTVSRATPRDFSATYLATTDCESRHRVARTIGVSNIPTRDAVRAILAKQFRAAEELPNKGGITEGFQVCSQSKAFNCYGVCDDVIVSHYIPPPYPNDRAPRRGMMHWKYAEALMEHYNAVMTEYGVRVSAKRAVLTDDALADELRAAYQSGGERTRESWIAVAKRARELLAAKT